MEGNSVALRADSTIRRSVLTECRFLQVTSTIDLNVLQTRRFGMTSMKQSRIILGAIVIVIVAVAGIYGGSDLSGKPTRFLQTSSSVEDRRYRWSPLRTSGAAWHLSLAEHTLTCLA